MIGHLRGRLLSISAERLLLDVHGVGYELLVPLSTAAELSQRSASEEISLFVHTHLRDDEISLFGFATERERTLFERLISVSGVGPRLARVILSGMPPGDLVAALLAGDVARLSTVSGVGKKTAQRLALELREKVGDLQGGSLAPAGSPEEDLVMALVNLGYRRGIAEQALARARREQPDGEFAELLRLALRSLGS